MIFRSLRTNAFLFKCKCFQSMTIRQAINSAMHQEMERDMRVFLIGEQVANYHGAYKVSKGLIDKFGSERIQDTPISEMGFTGIGIGAALFGLKPIIEYMTINFSMQAIDLILNSCAKMRYMSSGQLSSSIVFRGLNGPAAAVGAQHSQCFAAWYGNIPGLLTLVPYDAEDARGLLKSAIRDPNPVMYLQNQHLYSQSFLVDQRVMDRDFLIPIGQGKIMKKGRDITIVGYGRMVGFSIKAAQMLEDQGYSCQVINLRCIRPLDRKLIVQSVKKTKRLITVQDGWPQSGVGAEILALIMECFFVQSASAFNYLQSAPRRITGADIPMPYGRVLQQKSSPSIEDIKKVVKQVCNFSFE